MIRLRTLLVFGLPIVALGIVTVFLVQTREQVGIANPSSQAEEIQLPTSTPTPLVESATVTSIYGDHTLTLTSRSLTDGATAYVVTVEDAEGEVEILNEVFPAGVTLSLPQNSFSPHDRFFFFRRTVNDVDTFLVYRTDGKLIVDGEGTLDVKSLFDLKGTGYILSDVTGWDSPTLLHILTQDENGERGPSYWFEVPNGALIRLATR